MRKRKCHPGLRLRLWLAALSLLALTVLAVVIGVLGLTRTQGHAAQALAAQARIEAYGSFSARTNDWLIAWLTGQTPSPAPVLASLDRLDQLIAEDVATAPSAEEAAGRARQSITPARLRGLFQQLNQTLSESPPGTEGGEAALAFFAAQAPMVTSQQIDQETRRRESALSTMESLRRPLLWAALAIPLAAGVVLVALYALVMRPLFNRLSMVTNSADTLVLGDLPDAAEGHDELGLMLARLRQMARRIARRQMRLAQDYDHLEGIVSGRTAALSEANARLAHIDATRRRFFADVGHELRTPLTVIMGEAELGARHPDAATRAGFEVIHTRAMRLFRRIEDLLRIARSESGQLELTRGLLDLRATFEEARADLAPVLKRAGLDVQIDLPSLQVMGDGEWLRQVFAGLLENAAKYAGRGAVVTIRGAARNGMAGLEIRDSGAGISPELRPHVFERFSRSETAPGFGVGLALAAWVVEASGGSMALTPAEEPGFGLEINLPLWEGR